jgi:hypothetical protein
MVLAAALAAGAANAGNAAVMQETDCKLVKASELSRAVNQASKDTGLDLPRGMAVRTEVRCTRDAQSKRFVYTIRAAIEKQVNDGEAQRWAVLAQHTSYGMASGSADLLREVRFTVRDVIRQEP